MAHFFYPIIIMPKNIFFFHSFPFGLDEKNGWTEGTWGRSRASRVASARAR